MAEHQDVLVPLEAWAYSSPSIMSAGRSIDMGLFAEALIYYDRVIVNTTNQPQFSRFLEWFLRQGQLDTFYGLLEDGHIGIYDYAFMTTAIENQGVYSVWNIQDQIQASPDTFEQRYLYHPEVEQLFRKARDRRRLYRAIRGNVIEVKSTAFSSAIENARKDVSDHRRHSVVVQAFLDELYRYKGLGHVPEIQAVVKPHGDGTNFDVTWNIDFEALSRQLAPELGVHKGTPIIASAHSNRLIWSAAELGADIYLPAPMSALVGDKLYESTQRIAKAGNIIESLKAEVEFPDIHALVNSGEIQLADILKIRNKARRFRGWLQQESGRDRNAILAYHNEVARESGITRGVRKAISIFGILGGGAVGTLVGGAVSGAEGGAIGAAAGSAVSYLADVVAKIDANWRPVVFGDWLRSRIEELVDDEGK